MYVLFHSLQISDSFGLFDPQCSLYHSAVPGPGAYNTLLGGECSILKLRKRTTEIFLKNIGLCLVCCYLGFFLCIELYIAWTTNFTIALIFHPEGTPVRCWNRLNCLDKQWLYSELLQNDQASHPISKQWSRHPILVSQILFFWS